MFEVEAKVWVKDQTEWNTLLKQIHTLATYLKTEVKEDCYFAYPNSTHALFRLRTTNQTKHKVTVKKKEIINGMEQSLEEEFEVSSQKTFLSFTRTLDLNIIQEKTKHSQIYKYDNAFIELNNIRTLGNFLEIEILCSDQTQTHAAQTKIIQIFQKLGFNSTDFEERTYLKLLKVNTKIA